jgi:Carboxypeptidase regulatory-like domain
MVVRAVFAVAVALICWVATSCHPATQSPGSGPAPAAADTVRDAVITGTVVDSATGRPLPGALVIVMAQGKDPYREREHVAGVLTDSAGQYTLRVLHGRYDVWYSRLGWQRLRLPGIRARRAKQDSVVVRLPQSHVQLDPTVASGGATKCPEGPGDTADTSHFVTLAGTVVDSSDNRPVPGVLVIVTHLGQRPGEGHAASANTNEAGQYALRVPCGRYDVQYRRIGFSVEQRLGVPVSATGSDSIVIKLRENRRYIDPILVKPASR